MRRTYLFAVAVVIAGCPPPPVESPTTVVEQETTVRPPRKRDKVDILFIVDDSGSMTPKQTELKNKFGGLIRQLQSFKDSGHGAHYHIGVVTTEVERSGADCSGRSGPQGRLVPRGAAADASCQAVTGGVRYIDFNQNDGTNNLPAGQDLERTFQCMASVGNRGCGLEMQLESAYRALNNPPAENQGFLRPEALLVVVWITDEDDCSMAADSPLFGVGNLAAYPDGLGFPGSFRCVQFGYQCGGQQPPSMPGVYNMCGPLPNPSNDPGKLYDVQKYLDFFTKDNGAKEKKEDVILVSISGPSSSRLTEKNRIETVLFTYGTGAPCSAYKIDMTNFDRSCIFGVVPTCSSRIEANWTGDPAIRLESVVSAAMHHQVTSICEDSYAPALEGLGTLILSALGNCLVDPIADPEQPDCVVQELLDNNGTLSTAGVIPSCVASGGVKPCWSLATNTLCKKVPNPISGTEDQFEVKIDRGGTPENPNHLLSISCSTLAYRQQ